MSKDNLIHQLHELGVTKKAPYIWREQTRARLLAKIEVTNSVPFSLTERVVYSWQNVRLALAPMHLAPVIAVLLLMVIGYSPFSAALASSMPGSPLYPVKRATEKIELSLRSSTQSQGLFYLTLAGRRLVEAKAIANYSSQADLLRDYNINLGFAAASLETGLASQDLAKAYDQATDILEANLKTLKVESANKPVFNAAQDLTGKVSARALALLVSNHAGGRNGVESADVANRLATEIAKVEAKLESVEAKIQQFPEVKSASRVVITSKAAVVPVAEASKQAKDNLTAARELVAQKQFSLALEKVQESEDITAKSEAAVEADSEVSTEETTTEEGASTETTTDEAGEVKGETTDTSTDKEGTPETSNSTDTPAPTFQIDTQVNPKP